MITFMDYIVQAFGTSTDWNPDNSYSALTATSDNLLSFETPKTLSLHVSSLSSNNFASSYTLSTLGHIDGAISYLYTSHALGHIPAQSPSIPLRNLTRGYRDLRLPRVSDYSYLELQNGRKPILSYATLALPPPSVLRALYVRRINPETLLSLSLESKSPSGPNLYGGPPASVLAHVQRDTGQYSVEGLFSTDSALLGARGLWNFGLAPTPTGPPPGPADTGLDAVEGSPDLFIPPSNTAMQQYQNRLASKPSLLSAGAEFYYSPVSHVIACSTGLRFTTLAPHITPNHSQSLRSGKPLAGTAASLLIPSNIPHSSFPYTMTLTLNPLMLGIASTYSVRPTPNLALSSRFDFNFYSWESTYVLGAEIWRGSRGSRTVSLDDPNYWAKEKLKGWFSPEELALKEERFERHDENVLKLRVDDGWNFRALWTGRVKALLVSAGVTVSPASVKAGGPETQSLWKGSFGMSVAYST